MKIQTLQHVVRRYRLRDPSMTNDVIARTLEADNARSVECLFLMPAAKPLLAAIRTAPDEVALFKSFGWLHEQLSTIADEIATDEAGDQHT